MESSLFVGNPLQTSGAQTIQFLEGKAAGLKMIRMYNEAGLSMLVAPDRGMDIPELKGRPQGSSPRATWNDWQYAG